MSRTDLILAVETSSRIGSVAIALGGKMLAEVAFSAALKHSAELLPAMSALLESYGREPGQIEHIYISAGPGSFTGLRIAAAFAKTMHLANGASLIPRLGEHSRKRRQRLIHRMTVVCAPTAMRVKSGQQGISG